jgi:hypothetical protein
MGECGGIGERPAAGAVMGRAACAAGRSPMPPPFPWCAVCAAGAASPNDGALTVWGCMRRAASWSSWTSRAERLPARMSVRWCCCQTPPSQNAASSVMWNEHGRVRLDDRGLGGCPGSFRRARAGCAGCAGACPGRRTDRDIHEQNLAVFGNESCQS